MSASRVSGDRTWTPDGQHAPPDASQAIAHVSAKVAQRLSRSLHRARQHADAVLQQRAVGRIVHIRFYNRCVDAKATPVRKPGTLRHVHHAMVQLLDDLGPRARAIFRIVFPSGTSAASMRVKARYTKIGTQPRVRGRRSSNRTDASGYASATRPRRGVPKRPRRRLCGQHASDACATVSTTASSSGSVSTLCDQSGHSLCPSGSNTSNRLRSRFRRRTMHAPVTLKH